MKNSNRWGYNKFAFLHTGKINVDVSRWNEKNLFYSQRSEYFWSFLYWVWHLICKNRNWSFYYKGIIVDLQNASKYSDFTKSYCLVLVFVCCLIISAFCCLLTSIIASNSSVRFCSMKPMSVRTLVPLPVLFPFTACGSRSGMPFCAWFEDVGKEDWCCESLNFNNYYWVIMWG